MAINPFDFANSINYTKENIMLDDVAEKDYNSFIVNRQLSYFQDTVLLSNEMNFHHQIDNSLKYQFLLNTVRKRKRFSKWIKPELVSDMEVVKEYYGYNNEKARQSLSLLRPDQLEDLRKRVFKGGRKPSMVTSRNAGNNN